MADDAAGAVRRTPRPARDDLINQAAQCIIDTYAQYAPVPGVLHSEAGNIAHALADADLLPDHEQCQEINQDWQAYKQRKIAERRQLTAERDLALWLHAELQHKLTLPCGECHPCSNWADETWRRAGRKPPHVVTWEDKLAETRGLYARLDDAIKLIEEMSNHLRQEPALTIGVETRLAALRADEPGEPETGCMNGPAKQHTLRMVEIIKALKAASADGALPGELDDRASFAQLARAIVDHWPTGEVDRG